MAATRLLGGSAVSVQAITWALSIDDPDDPITRFVLVALANYADDYGVCWPAQSTLLENVKCSERKLRNCLRELVEGGFIEVVERRRPNGSRRSNAYLLIGFEGRKIPQEAGDHPIIAPPDVAPPSAADTSNRHDMPPAATGTTCRATRHHVPDPPAPRAPLEPSIEPSKESTPLTPQPLHRESGGAASSDADGGNPAAVAVTPVHEMSAQVIKEGKPYLCRHISARVARECLAAGLVTEEECRRSEVAL